MNRVSEPESRGRYAGCSLPEKRPRMNPARRLPLDLIIWLTACVLFVAGIFLPMFTFHKFFIFNDTFSLAGGIWHLLGEGEVFLFLVILLFSILGPLYKLYLLGTLIRGRGADRSARRRRIKRLAVVGKWSMADVFVIAVIVSSVKLGLLASVSVLVGIVCFGLSVLMSMLLVQRQMAGYEFREKDGTS